MQRGAKAIIGIGLILGGILFLENELRDSRTGGTTTQLEKSIKDYAIEFYKSFRGNRDSEERKRAQQKFESEVQEVERFLENVKMGDPDNENKIDRIIEIYEDRRYPSYNRYKAVDALGRVGGARVYYKLMEISDKSSGDVLSSALDGIARINGETALDEFTRKLQEANNYTDRTRFMHRTAYLILKGVPPRGNESVLIETFSRTLSAYPNTREEIEYAAALRRLSPEIAAKVADEMTYSMVPGDTDYGSLIKATLQGRQ